MKNKKVLSRLVATVENFPISLFPLIREIREDINLGMPYSKLERTIELFDKKFDDFCERIDRYREEMEDYEGDI